MNRAKNSLFIIITFALSGCASVTVEKIPNTIDYEIKDRYAIQKAADAIKGNRYYLPRPFIAVGKEFPYKSSSIYAHGKMAPDGSSVEILEEISFKFLNDTDETKIIYNIGENIPINRIFLGKEGARNIKLEGETANLSIGKNAIGEPAGGNSIGVPAKTGSYVKPLSMVKKLVDWNEQTTKYIKSTKNVVRLKFKLNPTETITSVKRENIRDIYLLKVKDGKPDQSKKIVLPKALYKDNGEFDFLGLIADASEGKYVLGVDFIQKNGSSCDRHPIVEDPQTQSFIEFGGNQNEINLGSLIDPLSTRGLEIKKGVKIEIPIKLTGSKSSLIDFHIEIADIKATDAGEVDEVKSIALLRKLDDGNFDFENAKYLPIEGGKLTDKNYTYLIKDVYPEMLVGKYHIVLLLASETSSTYIYSSMPTLEVQNYQSSNYPEPTCKEVLFVPQVNTPAVGVTPENPTEKKDENNSNESDETSKQPIEKGSTKVEETLKAGGGLLSILATSNPNTKPVLDVNDYFKILYLPDFEEQYAINVKANLSKSEMAISLENGWLLENFASQIDNRALANFFFLQIGETLDLVRDVVRLDKQLIAPILTDEKNETEENDVGPILESESVDQNRLLKLEIEKIPVLLKIHKVSYAVPGVYPILKQKELLGGYGGTGSVVRFDTRADIIIELVRFNKNESK
ncbi:hypothetical protein HRH59_19075 [Rheinheimera sp. YQF-2]|uniref:Uncharacterized protein n=1 Tax=Rheinheimera lutimaris TaxID=2740584 RepID=A0A7Y5EK86_9GAMM|nr:hypothetical protein [Rheinheimera lutimaris]NRQ44642.1 hypothetical protein [Rheinheimera lutimaris]